MAQLILDYYKGSDLYSDGTAIEESILQIVKEDRCTEVLNDKNTSYAALYHLSPVRENILNWYPFQNTDHVLEVGAGPGAITGELCRVCGTVTAVDLSYKRAQINYERHHQYDNLRILVGNLNDMQFKEKFDYIVLNGVLEYAALFTDTDNPFVDFLSRLAMLLTPTGKMLIAIENRLGLKYFSGASEDHSGQYFDGLQNYARRTDVARTFSRSELETMLAQAGLSHYKFYFPYPDYKFPQEIFTQDSLCQRIIGRKYNNLDAFRLYLFPEDEINGILAREGTLASFANSFFVEASVHAWPQRREIEYVKLSTDRAKELRQITTIFKQNNTHTVVKKMLIPQGIAHFQEMQKLAQACANPNIQYLPGQIKNEEFQFPYLQSQSLLTFAGTCIAQKDAARLQTVIQHFFTQFFYNAKNSSTYCNAAFAKIFGDTVLSTELLCATPCNIDVLAENVFLEDGKFIIIDYEWIFDFAIPVTYPEWRMLNDLYTRFADLEQIIPREQWYAMYGITSEMIEVFLKWTDYFANQYVQNDQLHQFDKPLIPVDLSRTRNDSLLDSTLYFDFGDGLSQKNSVSVQTVLQNGDFEVDFALSMYSNLQALSWDPIENKFCICKIESAVDQCGQSLHFVPNSPSANRLFANGMESGNLFLTIDPRYYCAALPDNIRSVKIKGHIEFLSEQDAYPILYQQSFETQQQLAAVQQTLADTQQTLADTQQALADMQQTLTNTQRQRAVLQEKYNRTIKGFIELRRKH
ncbi:MAG: class I SAM-dependent methyltransferase [Ruthenibacterium sp.]